MNYKKILGLASPLLLLGGCADSVKMELPTNGIIENKIQSIAVKEVQLKTVPKINEVLAAQIREFSEPSNQDRAAVEGGGLYQEFSKNLALHCLSPRRQTLQVPAELISMMPESFGRDVAIIVPERLLQQPLKITKLNDKKKVILTLALTGAGNIDSIQDYDSTSNKLEFARLNTAIQLIKVYYPKLQIEVVSGFGDTLNKEVGSKILSKLQSRLDSMLIINGVSKAEISTGADELVSLSIASQLPIRNIAIYISNPAFENRYDAGKTTSEIVIAKTTQSNLKEVSKEDSPDLFVFIVTPGAENTEVELEKIALQIFDLKKKNPFVESKIAFVDSLRPNGSTINPKLIKKVFDKYKIDFGRITFGSWGTGGNVIGDTMARLKVQNNLSENRKTDEDIEKIRAFRFQAFAHDMIFLNKSLRSELRQEFIDAGINFDPTNSRLNYDLIPRQKSKLIIEVTENFVNKKMIEMFGDEVGSKYYFKLSYGFRRLFEINIQAIDPKTNKILIATPILIQR